MKFEKIPQTTVEVEKELQEKINIVKDLEIGPVQKAEIMLVILGLKPATELSLYKHNDTQDKVEKVLKDVGLEIDHKNICDNKNLVAEIVIAQNQKILSNLMQANASQDHEEYGRLMGYPETAISAFTENTILNEVNYPELQTSIFGMKYSKNNWQEEKLKVQSWDNAIKKYAPETYRDAGGNME